MTFGLCLALLSGATVMAQSPESVRSMKENVHMQKDGKKHGKKDKDGKKHGKKKCDKYGKDCPKGFDNNCPADCPPDCPNPAECDSAQRGPNPKFYCALPGPNGERPGDNVNPQRPKHDLFEGIEMTPEQKAKVDELNGKKHEKMKEASKKHREKMDKVRKDGDKKREKLAADYEKDLAKVLTPAQMAQYKQNQAKAKEARDARRGDKKNKCHKERRQCEGAKKPGVKAVQPAPQPDVLTD